MTSYVQSFRKCRLTQDFLAQYLQDHPEASFEDQYAAIWNFWKANEDAGYEAAAYVHSHFHGHLASRHIPEVMERQREERQQKAVARQEVAEKAVEEGVARLLCEVLNTTIGAARTLRLLPKEILDRGESNQKVGDVASEEEIRPYV